MIIQFDCVEEKFPDIKWQVLFNKTWPFYKQWFLSEGLLHRKGYLSSETMLRQHMPELMPVYEKLTQLAPGDMEARYLSMYCPPPYMTGCSQLVWNREKLFLIRNYDYNPSLFEAVMYHTHWLKPVIGMSDCNWGLLDGMNADGLAASLAFGGRKISGEGFGIPLVIRYLLETTSTVQEAVEKLKILPVHMPYSITLADATGNHATVFVSPDREPVINYSPAATNHQMMVEWPEYATLTATEKRLDYLESILKIAGETEDTVVQKFLQPPLFNYNYAKSFGTLYTSQYCITDKKVKLYWQDNNSVTQSFENFQEISIPVSLPVEHQSIHSF